MFKWLDRLYESAVRSRNRTDVLAYWVVHDNARINRAINPLLELKLAKRRLECADRAREIADEKGMSFRKEYKREKKEYYDGFRLRNTLLAMELRSPSFSTRDYPYDYQIGFYDDGTPRHKLDDFYREKLISELEEKIEQDKLEIGCEVGGKLLSGLYQYAQYQAHSE